MTTASWYDLGHQRGFDLGVDLGARPALGAVRRLRSWSQPGDPQAELVRAVAAELEALRLALATGARADELRARLARALAVAEGEAVGALARRAS